MANFTPISVERGGDTLTSALIEDDRIIIKHDYNIAPTLEAIKKASNDFDKYAPYNKNMRCVASIPMVILDDLIYRGIAKSKKKMREWLNDPDNRVFRVSLEKL